MLDETATNQRQSEDNRQEALKQLSQRSQQENNIIEQLQRIVDEKEMKIRTLLEQLQQMQNAVGHFILLTLFTCHFVFNLIQFNNFIPEHYIHIKKTKV